MQNKTSSIAGSKYLILLAILCATFLDLGVVFQPYLVSMGPYYFSATVFVYPFTCIILDIVAEVYGYQVARVCLWFVILTNFIFGMTIALFIHLLPTPQFWSAYTASFDSALGPALRTVNVGIFSMIVGQFINIYLISKLRILTKGKFFALRSMSSTIVGDTLTAVIALSLNFLGRTSGIHILIIVITELLILYIIAFILAFPGAFIAFLLKRKEKVQYSDKVSFNPFLLRVE